MIDFSKGNEDEFFGEFFGGGLPLQGAPKRGVHSSKKRKKKRKKEKKRKRGKKKKKKK